MNELARRLIAAQEQESPHVAELAELASLAVRVDAGLLRRLRLELLPAAEPGVESDLWFSLLVESRSESGFQMAPDVQHELRKRLAGEPARVAEVRRVTAAAHADCAPAILLEEELNGLALEHGAAAQSAIETRVKPVFRTLAGEGSEALDVSRWMVQASARLDPLVKRVPAVQALLLASALRVRSHVASDVPRDATRFGDFAWALPSLASVATRRFLVTFVEGGVRLDEAPPAGDAVQTPDLDPALIEVEWEVDGQVSRRITEAKPGADIELAGNPNTVVLTTLVGRRYRLSRVNVDHRTTITCVRKSSMDAKAAIIFVQGFTGSGATTWTELLPRIEAQRNLESWDIYTVTYATSLSLDISELWPADANLKTLGQRLATDLAQAALAPYNGLVLIAHSMGGLVVQKALVDYPTLVRRTRCVILLGTPSDGLKKSSGAASLLKRQLKDMAWGSPFITALRADWQAKFGDRLPFSFLAVAGERDQFVPPDSSLAPFPLEQQAVVPGNHVSMLSPAAADDNLVRLIDRRICDEKAGDVGDSALRMIERGEFQRLIEEFYDRAAGLDEKALVQLAIALDAVGRRDDAYRLLSERLAGPGDADRSSSVRFAKESDTLGALAGLRKREWLQKRQKADGDAAFEHYKKGLELARAGNNLSQAYYHGINLAFLEFVFKGDREAAQKQARQALRDCEEAERRGEADEWLEATRGEAELILNDPDAAFAAYRKFVASVSAPWKLTSSYLNARTITQNHPNRELVRRLGQIFGDPNP